MLNYVKNLIKMSIRKEKKKEQNCKSFLQFLSIRINHNYMYNNKQTTYLHTYLNYNICLL